MIGDRRKYQRKSQLFQVKVVSQSTVLQVMTTNVSPTGAFFASSKILPSGDKVDVFIHPKGSKIPRVKLRAEVVREVHGGAGGQPGFAVRWLTAYSEVGRRPMVQFLRQVLGVPGVREELLPSKHFVEVQFPEVGAPFPFSSQRPQRVSTGPIPSPGSSGSRASAPRPAAAPRGTPSRTSIATKVANHSTEDTKPAAARVATGSPTPASPTTPAVVVRPSPQQEKKAPLQVPLRKEKSPAIEPSRAPKPTGRRSGLVVGEQPLQAPRKRRLETPAATPASAAPSDTESPARQQSESQDAEKASPQEGSSRSAESTDPNEDVPVDVPVTYQVYNKLIPGRLVRAGMSAVQVRTHQLVPELNEELIINVPVDHQGEYRTVFLTGRFMKLADKGKDSAVLLIHVNHIQEGRVAGAYGKFLAFSRTAPT